MNIRKDWMTNNTLFGSDYDKQLQLQEVTDRFDTQRYSSNEGYEVEIDGVDEQVVIQNYSNPLNQDRVDKKLHCSIDSVVKIGSLVEWENNTWLVVTLPNSNKAYVSAKILLTNTSLKFYNKNGILITLPCVMEKDRYYDFQNDKYIILPRGQYRVLVQYNTDSQEIRFAPQPTRFMVEDDAYRVENRDKVTYVRNGNGYIDLLAKLDTIAEQDDTTNDIAYNIENTYTPTTPITNGVQIYNTEGNSPSNKIRPNQSIDYKCIFYYNSATTPLTSVFSVTEDDGTTLATSVVVSIQDGTANTCTITDMGGSRGGYVRLYVRDSGSTVLDYVRIRLVSLSGG